MKRNYNKLDMNNRRIRFVVMNNNNNAVVNIK